jgi:hypothetical protein
VFGQADLLDIQRNDNRIGHHSRTCSVTDYISRRRAACKRHISDIEASHIGGRLFREVEVDKDYHISHTPQLSSQSGDSLIHLRLIGTAKCSRIGGRVEPRRREVSAVYAQSNADRDRDSTCKYAIEDSREAAESSRDPQVSV